MTIIKFLTSFFSIRKLRIGVSVSGTVQDKLTVSWLYDTIFKPDGAIGRPETTAIIFVQMSSIR